MDYENERILKLIFPLGIPDDLQENPETLEYLFKLGSYKVEQLKKEEHKLSENNKSVIEQTQDLAISNYKTFIQTSECSREIFREFKNTEKRLDDLFEKIPSFNSKCTEFVTNSNEINKSRRLNSLTLQKNAQLLEILEMPQLMETCIRERKYEEALELAAYVQRLSAKHSNIPVIKCIANAIEDSWYTMLTQLLNQLRSDLQLPKCLQIVGYLRRMQAFSSTELKLKFLQARENWMKDTLSKIPNDDHQFHLTKTIEVTRVNLFNIVTQYKAIFAEDESNSGDKLMDDTDSGQLFYAWLHERIDRFLKTLERDLPHCISSLDTILNQCMYFGLSLSRVGIDFRGVMSKIFIDVITKNCTRGIFNSTKQFEKDLELYTLINKNANEYHSKSVLNKEENIAPPDTLLDFQPLAVYCNGILTTFNDLRVCTPVATANDITKSLQQSLENVAKTILSFYRQEQQAFIGTERECFIRFCTCFAYDLLPYLQRCLHILFPLTTVTQQLGVSNSFLQAEGFLYLNTKKILEPLDYLLPDKVEAIIQQVAEQKLQEKAVEEEKSNNETQSSQVEEGTTPNM